MDETEEDTQTSATPPFGSGEDLNDMSMRMYNELRRLARWQLRSPGATLQPTALVHEVYLRLANGTHFRCESRAHFFAIAAQLMRRILVDHFRTKSAEKRGGGAGAITLHESVAIGNLREVDLVDLDTALNELAHANPQAAQIIELRFFVGLSIEDIAAVTNVSPATVKRQWTAAKTWIKWRLSNDRKQI